MRHIKFRVWIEPDGDIPGQMCYDYAYEEYEPINDLLNATKNLMQFTGLHDKNGKEIYEGDLLLDEPTPMVVQWNHRLACFGLERKGWAFTHFFQEAINSDKCEVIGNIHQNSDLL